MEHQNAVVTRYAHAEALLVKQGDAVQKSQAIARVGSTGRSTGPHLHYEVLRDGMTTLGQR
jgi:murein DD-endopeptidase MepM/ murein hydrolase activator NlpD